MISHLEWNQHIDDIRNLQEKPRQELISEILTLQDELLQAVARNAELERHLNGWGDKGDE